MTTTEPESRFREALSALLDGEEPAVPVREVVAHLATCSGCSAWLDAAMDANVRVRDSSLLDGDLGESVVDAVDVHLCGCASGVRCDCRNCQCGPGCTCLAPLG